MWYVKNPLERILVKYPCQGPYLLMKLRFRVLGFLSSVIKARCSPRPLDTLHSPFFLLDILHDLVGNKTTVNLCLERTGMTATTTL